jgi:hypothetical protein
MSSFGVNHREWYPTFFFYLFFIWCSVTLEHQAWTGALRGATPLAHKESSRAPLVVPIGSFFSSCLGTMRTRHSKSPLPLVQSMEHLDGFIPDPSVNSHVEEQVGGRHCQPSPPPHETSTRLCTQVKASQKAHHNAVAQQAELRHARMGGDDIVPLASESPEVPIADDSDPITAVFLAPQQASCEHSDAPTLSHRSTSPPPFRNKAREEGTHQHTMPVMHIIPPTPTTAISTDIPIGCTASTEVVGISDPLAPTSAAPDSDGGIFSINVTAEPSTPTSAQRAAAVNANTDGGASSIIVNADDPSTPTSGRRTTTVNSTLAAGYNQLEVILSKLIEETSLTTQQVLEGWHKSRGRTVNGTNHWNLYTRYTMKHEEQERQRLSIVMDVPCKSHILHPASMPAKCSQLHLASVTSCIQSSKKTM